MKETYILLIGGSLSGVTPAVEGGLKSVYVAAWISCWYIWYSSCRSGGSLIFTSANAYNRIGYNYNDKIQLKKC